MSMKTVSLTQGSTEWHAHRAKHFNASDAPAMMGCSSYKTRSELIKELATGLSADIDPATQRRFDDGHRFEALARPLAEEIIGEGLSPCVGVRGKYSASFDGLTFMHNQAFEHKTLNKKLREAMFEGCTGTELPLEYRVQMEHQAMVSGCERILFMASIWELTDGCPRDADDAYTMTERKYCWYEPDAELRAQIIAGWEQLEKVVAAYVPAAAEPVAPTEAKLRDSLPVLRIDAKGEITASNLDDFKEIALSRINSINTVLETDQQFADADADAKWLREVSSAMKQAGKQVRSNMQSVDDVLNVLEQLDQIATKKAIDLEKRVKSEKDVRKQSIVMEAQQDLDAHVAALNQRLGANWLPRVAGGFAEAIKGLKSLDSMRDKVAVALTNAKHDANMTAQRLEANRKHLVQTDGDWIALFADFATVGAKAEEDFQALAALRIGNHKHAEAQRLEAQREQIRKEEAARLEREAAAKAKAEAEEAERVRQAAEAQAAAQAKAVIDAAAAPAAKAKCDGNHGGQPCGDHECWQLPPPEGVLTDIEQQFQILESEVEELFQNGGATQNELVSAKPEGTGLKLGQVNTMLKDAGLGQISAETLEANGIAFSKERGAVHIQASDLQRLLLKMAMGMRKLADDLAVTA